MFIEQPVHFTN